MISKNWLTSLRLEDRKAPEFIQAGDDLSEIPHGALIQKSFDELGLAAIHCISGVPSIAFLVQEEFNQEEIDRVHKALWNQGLATLLLVINNETLRAFSLCQLPDNEEQSSDRLVKVLDLLSDALEIKNIILGMESGRFVDEHRDKFNSRYRIDQVLLINLESTVEKLVEKKLSLESAQALLMQIMFIAYLEDRGLINEEYFSKSTDNSKIISLLSLLNDGRANKFLKLFKQLKLHFNGDMFVTPCSFESNSDAECFTEEHINIISEFRAGNINLSSGQLQFWPYDFKFIPIDLISAVYDRFLGFEPSFKRNSGAYYTPMFLADLVAEQAWSELSSSQRKDGVFVDPSCGSGIFLVRLFEKMIGEWRSKHNNKRPTWPALNAMIKRIHGFDIKKEAIRVAAFSLYIALLENTRPAEIQKLMDKGRLLPKLCGETLRAIDFFRVSCEEFKYDLIIGNPPWVSRREGQRTAEDWCRSHGFDMPTKEVSWGFAWKALSHCKDNAVNALLLKATSFITSQSTTVLSARKKWMDSILLKRVINFADTRFQLFDGGDAPTALMLFKPKTETRNYYFDYWVPKADVNLKTKRLMTLSSADKSKLPIRKVIEDQLVMKRRMWMQTPDAKLFQYLSSKPKLGEKVISHQKAKKADEICDKWTIGQGFNPAQEHRLEEQNYKTVKSDVLTTIPHLDVKSYCPIVMPNISTKPWHTNRVYRRNFEGGYEGPHILIPQGIERVSGRLRASYSEQSFSFRTTIQAIKIDKSSIKEAKFLTLLLNSSLVAWYLFHNSSISGVERDKVPQQELLEVPFPLPNSFSNKRRANNVFNKAVKLFDEIYKVKDNLLKEDISSVYSDLDKVIYEYFELTPSDILIIENTLNEIIPSMQPRLNSKQIPNLWKETSERDWKAYSKYLVNALNNWLEKPVTAYAGLVGATSDVVIMSVSLKHGSSSDTVVENRNVDVDKAMSKVWKELPEQLPGNFQLIPDLRIFMDDVLYIVKPRKRRFWLSSTAFADADAIASDLLGKRRAE